MSTMDYITLCRSAWWYMVSILDTPSDSAFKVVWKKVGHKHETELTNQVWKGGQAKIGLRVKNLQQT